MSLNISISIRGGRETSAKLGRIGTQLLNFTNPMKQIGEQFVDFYSSEPFVTEGGIYGDHWAALAPSTLREKANKFPGRGMEIRTGKMQQGFRAETNIMSARIFNITDYFRFPQQGTSNMPQRLIMGLTQERLKTVADIIKRDVEQKLRNA